MAEPPNHTQETKPNPDPTIATNEAVERAMKSERDYVDGKINVIAVRLDGMDTATSLRLGQFEDLPGQIDEKVTHLRELTEEKFNSVDNRFNERDDRSKSEGVANEVKVNAAFAAQEKLAVQYNLASQASIDKSEKNTYELIRQNQETTKVALQSQADQISDLKDRLTKQESVDRGRKEGSETWKYAIGLGISLILLSITIVGFIIANKPN